MAGDFQSAFRAVTLFCERHEGLAAVYEAGTGPGDVPHRDDVVDIRYNQLIGELQRSMRKRRRALWYANHGRRWSDDDHARLLDLFRGAEIAGPDLDEVFARLGAELGRSPQGVRWELAQVLRRDRRSNQELARAFGKTVMAIKLIKEDQVHTDLGRHAASRAKRRRAA